MRIQIGAEELQVGDVYQDRVIVQVSPSTETVYIEFEDGTNKQLHNNAVLLVERKVERIEQ